MPELPEVETVRRGLAPVMEGARFTKVEARRGDLRWPLPKDFVARLEGRTVERPRPARQISARRSLLRRRAADASRHVGLVPRRRERTTASDARATYHHDRSKDRAHDHVVFHMSIGRADFLQRSAPIRLDEDRSARQARSGAAVARDRTRAARQRLRRRDAGAGLPGKKTSLKAALLDQKRGAGLGNIYVCEALYRARLSPRRRPRPRAAVGRAERARRTAGRCHPAVLGDAIKAGGSSLRDHRRTDGELGFFQHHFRVYDREGEPCPTPGCKGTIRRIVQNGRSTFYCPVCQR